MKFNIFLLFLLPIMLFSGTSSADPSHAYISISGDDSKDCSYNAPCKTFASALNKLVVAGTLTALDSGEYQAFQIFKPVTINTAGENRPTIVGSIPDQTSSDPPSAILVYTWQYPNAVSIEGLNLAFTEGNQRRSGIALAMMWTAFERGFCA
jgi:hypothetical protein